MSCCYTEVSFRFDLISSCFILSTVSQANLTYYSSCLGSRSSFKSARRNLGKCLTLSRQRPWELYFKPPIPLANHKYHWYSCFHNLLRPRKTKKIIQLMVMALEHILAAVTRNWQTSFDSTFECINSNRKIQLEKLLENVLTVRNHTACVQVFSSPLRSYVDHILSLSLNSLIHDTMIIVFFSPTSTVAEKQNT